METQTPLGTFKSSDKFVGTFLAAVVVGALGYGLFILLPYLIVLAQNTIIFSAELVALILIAMVVLDKNTWATVYYGWRNVSKKVRKAIVREDPIGILDTSVRRFTVKLDEIDENMTQAVAATNRQRNAIAKAQKTAQAEMDMATAAKRLHKSDLEVQTHATGSQRWAQAALEMQPQQDMLLKVQTCLERARDLCASRLDDMRNQKAVLAVKLEAMQDSQKAVRRFKRFFGSNADLEMQEMAVEEIERQSTEAEAEIDQFMRNINPMLEGADLKRSADALRAMERFDTYVTTGKVPEPVPALPPVKEGVLVKKNTASAAWMVDTHSDLRVV